MHIVICSTIAYWFEWCPASKSKQEKTIMESGADEDVVKLPVQKRGVGFMFQSFALFKHMTVGENIAFGPRIQKQNIDLERR